MLRGQDFFGNNGNNDDDWGNEMEMLMFSGGDNDSLEDVQNRRKVLTIPQEWLDGSVRLPTDAEFARWVQQQLSLPNNGALVSSAPGSPSMSRSVSIDSFGEPNGNVMNLKQVMEGAASALAGATKRKQRNNVDNPYRRGDSLELTSFS